MTSRTAVPPSATASMTIWKRLIPEAMYTIEFSDRFKKSCKLAKKRGLDTGTHEEIF